MRQPTRILPHEILFGFFLVLTCVRLAFRVGIGDADTLLYVGLIVLNVTAIAWCLARPTNARWRLRLLFYPLAMNILFAHMRGAIPRLVPERFDAALNRIDTILTGVTPSLALQNVQHPVLTEFFSICYFLFFPYLTISLLYYLFARIQIAQRFWVGLFTVYAIGYVGYSFVPAWGPWIAMEDQFRGPLTGWYMTDLNDRVVRWGSNGVDVFPSLHCAVSCFILLFDYKHRPRRFRLYVVPCVGLWFSTLYLRYHYFIDVICGFLLAALALWLASRVRPHEELSHGDVHTDV